MEARPVDPRDERWQVTSPTYRVYFWEALSTPPAMASDEYELVDAADVHEVLAWADKRVLPHQSYEVFVVVDHPDRGLVRLAGLCPANPDEYLRWRPVGRAS
jgi:hypothetical protein